MTVPHSSARQLFLVACSTSSCSEILQVIEFVAFFPFAFGLWVLSFYFCLVSVIATFFCCSIFLLHLFMCFCFCIVSMVAACSSFCSAFACQPLYKTHSHARRKKAHTSRWKHQFIAIAFIAQSYSSPYFFLKSPSGSDICIKTSIRFHIYWLYNQWAVY